MLSGTLLFMANEQPSYSFTGEHLVEVCNTHPISEHLILGEQDQSVLFRDLVTDEPLEPGQIPPSVMLHPTLGLGIRYLKHRGQQKDLLVRLILAGHGSVQDFESVQQAHPDAFDVPFLGVETSWKQNAHDGKPLLRDSVELVLADDSGRRDFQLAQLAWLRDNNKLALPCEIASNDDSELLRRLDNIWNTMRSPAKPDNTGDTIHTNAIRTLVERVYLTTRQSAILGQFGYWLFQFDRTNGTPAEQVSLMLGSWHRPSARRIKKLGVDVEVIAIPHARFDRGYYKHYGKLVMRTMEEARASLELLNAPLPY